MRLSAGSGLIIDDSCTDPSRIPSAWIADAKSRRKIPYGQTSWGRQILAGMGALAAVNPAYSFNTSDTSGALDLRDTPYDGADDLGNPDRSSWAVATRNY